MIIAQSAATSRVYAMRHHERVDENADILGLAAANAGAALTGAFVVNGSPTQTAMADNAGARSQFAQLVFAGDRRDRAGRADRVRCNICRIACWRAWSSPSLSAWST